EKNFIQREIAESAYRYQREVDTGERSVVGVNSYLIDEGELRIPILKMDPDGEARHTERLARLRRERDDRRAQASLVGLQEAARTDQNLMPLLIEAVKAHATLGEICEALRAVFGAYRAPAWV
ncbi:MAG: methylmalonyl-CoA mutase, partial [Chloroflexi bacterium]|nr:methylmalonyl-CoA mutase [Chloroflexota bacterium]